MKVGLIGFGLAGKVFHAPHINACQGLELDSIVSSRKEEIKKQYPDVEVLKDIDELLKREIEIVVIATPNETHVSLATKALMNGCNVLIDKPFTPSLEESEKLIDLAKKQNLMISSFHNRRFDGDFLTLKELINSYRLGEIKLYESNFNRFRPELNVQNWRETTDIAGGVFYDLAPHILDQALHLFGTPKYVYLDRDNLREGAKNDDYFKAHLYYPSLKVELNAHCFQATPAARFRIQGSKGGFEKFGMDPQEASLKVNGYQRDQGRESKDNYGTLYSEDRKEVISTVDGNYLMYYENLRDALSGKNKLEVTAKDILDVQYTLELLIQSSEQGKRLKWERQ